MEEYELVRVITEICTGLSCGLLAVYWMWAEDLTPEDVIMHIINVILKKSK